MDHGIGRQDGRQHGSSLERGSPQAVRGPRAAGGDLGPRTRGSGRPVTYRPTGEAPGPLRRDASEDAPGEGGGEPPTGAAAGTLCLDTGQHLEQPSNRAARRAENDPLGEEIRRASWWKNWTAAVVGELAEQGEPERAEKLAGCGSWRLYREDSEGVRLRASDFCSMRRLCPACARASAARTVERATAQLSAVLDRDDVLPVMLTLTQPVGEDLAERLQNLQLGLRRLSLARRDGRKRRRPVEWNNLAGVVWHVEAKRASSGNAWHVHVHGLGLQPRGVVSDVVQLRREWDRAAGLDGSNIDVRLTDAGRLMLQRRQRFEQLLDSDRAAVRSDVAEVLKYAFKFEASSSPADVVSAWRAMHGKRLLSTWGTLRGVKLEDAAGDETNTPGRFRDSLFSWNWPTGGYVLDRSWEGTHDGHPHRETPDSATQTPPLRAAPQA